MNNTVDALLKGSFDLHVSADPVSGQEPRMDAIDTGRHAYEAGMGGFVLSSDYYLTATMASTLNRIYPGLTVIGSVTLNQAVGGLNPDAVQAATDLGAKVIWMPTTDAVHNSKKINDRSETRILADDGALLACVHDILDIVSDRDLVLASGHISVPERIALFKEANHKGIHRLLASDLGKETTIEEQREMISAGAYLEYCYVRLMPSSSGGDPRAFIASLETLGIERCIVTTGLGQWMNPPPAEGFRMAIASMLYAGINPDEVAVLVKINPIQLLDISIT